MIVYHRNSYNSESLDATVAHVRAQISSIASATDDPGEYAADVAITLSGQADGSTRVYGELDRDPVCDYTLPEGFELPDQSRYQRGFGVRNMTPEELQEHLIEKGKRQ